MSLGKCDGLNLQTPLLTISPTLCGICDAYTDSGFVEIEFLRHKY